MDPSTLKFAVHILAVSFCPTLLCQQNVSRIGPSRGPSQERLEPSGRLKLEGDEDLWLGPLRALPLGSFHEGLSQSHWWTFFAQMVLLISWFHQGFQWGSTTSLQKGCGTGCEL